MLTENDVIKHIVAYLENEGYVIISTANTRQTGIDISAYKNNKHLYVDAKGNTSSKEGTPHFGHAFLKKHAQNHIARAVLSALKHVNTNPKIEFALAFPDNINHTETVTLISPLLKKLGIGVFFVSENGRVRKE